MHVNHNKVLIRFDHFLFQLPYMRSHVNLIISCENEVCNYFVCSCHLYICYLHVATVFVFFATMIYKDTAIG